MRAQTLAQALAQAPPLANEADRDLEALDRFLRSDRSPPNSMMLSELDGFLTGLAVGPELVRPDEWLSLVWGGDAPALASADEATTIVGVLMRRRDAILREIGDGAFAPVFWTDRAGKIIAADWAEGFMEAIKLRRDAWRPLFESRHSTELLVPVLWHCRGKDGRALLGFGPAGNDALAEVATEAIPDCVAAIAAYWRRGHGRSPMTLVPAWRGEPYYRGEKIGRNEPCPCGSGKKFKRCCGGAA
ncbi:MAG TPA: UPF0149 family protein [Xanthobacteraceae bacterium]|nr:UPF0149 family protein [Xanthobacteraceae bacterium]